MTPAELFESNLDLVPKIVSRWNYDTPTLGDDDRRSIARIELWNASNRYGGSRPFRGYAAVRIANALRNAMRDDGRSRRVENESVSLDQLADNDSDVMTGNDYCDAITDSSDLAEDALSHHDELRTVKAACDALQPAQRAVIERRYLGDEQELLSDIGKSRGVSRERIRQIESDALVTLRKRLVA